jgi:hypothetical protein
LVLEEAKRQPAVISAEASFILWTDIARGYSVGVRCVDDRAIQNRAQSDSGALKLRMTTTKTAA